MARIIIPVIAFLIFIGIIVLLFRFMIRKNKEKNELFKKLALQLNLEYSEKRHFLTKLPCVTGDLNNKYVEIYERIVSSGKHTTTYTEIVFQQTPHNFEFRIGKEHFFSKIGKKIGFKDIEFDNHELDQKFLFKSKDESQFRALMDYKMLHELEGVASAIKGTIYNKRGSLSYSMVGVVNKPEKMADLVKVFKFMSRLMDNRR